MPYNPTDYSPQGLALRSFLESRQESNRFQNERRQEQQRVQQKQIEQQKAQAYQDSFVFHLDNPDQDKEVAIVMPEAKLPESLKNYKNMSPDEIRRQIGSILADPSQRTVLQEGYFVLDGNPAISAERDKIYSCVRETVLNMAKDGTIKIGNHSPAKLRLADALGKLKPEFDAGYKQQLEGMISRMIANNGNNNAKIAALVQRGR